MEEQIRKSRFNIIVADESHYLKNKDVFNKLYYLLFYKKLKY